MNYSDTVFDKCLRTVIRNDREQVIFIIRFTVCFMSSVLQKNEHVRDHVRPKDRSGEQYQFIIRTYFNGVRPNTKSNWVLTLEIPLKYENGKAYPY